MNASIIIDLIFGDGGKGITTDFKCRLNNPEKTMVVRFSGGQQAGHNVKIGDVSHVHSSFGSGTLRGYPSYFTEHCTIYPVNMLRELDVLKNKEVYFPDLYLHPLVMLTTPADVAYNRMIESKKGHGTCGLGIGATMKRNLNTGYKLYGIDLTNHTILEEKITNIYKYYRSLISNEEDAKIFTLEYDKEKKYFDKAIKVIDFKFRSYEFLKEYENVIFEGSQGIMLDMDHGIFPHVTFANTTSKNALEICKKLNINDIEILYVTRCYQTRHGAGWMSNNEEVTLINTGDEINVYNEWQEDFKIGELDYDLLNYSLSIDNLYSENIKKSLVVTCLDQRPKFKFDYSKLNTNFETVYESYSPDSINFKIIKHFETKD